MALALLPGGPLERAISTLEHLATIENAQVTVITGRRQDAYSALSRAGLPRRGDLIGWTDKMPDLIGIPPHFHRQGRRSDCPRGHRSADSLRRQPYRSRPRRGNIALIQQTAIGALASNSPADILHIVKGAMANDAALWRTWRKNLVQIQKPSASRAIAAFLLQQASSPKA
jgi:processive 1,2-diacylglycerol beta-glucosyltransferase